MLKFSEIEINEINPCYSKCPNCNYDFSFYKDWDVNKEFDTIIYHCENCDWEEFKKYSYYFFPDGWWVTVKQLEAPVDLLNILVSNKNVLQTLKPYLKKGKSHLSIEPFPNYYDNDEYLNGELGITKDILWGQLVILVSTYGEIILGDFFKCMFLNKPATMKRYLNNEKGKESLASLEKILNSDSTDISLESLVEETLKKVNLSRYDEKIEKLLNEASIEIEGEVKSKLESLTLLRIERNNFAHEAKGMKIKVEQIYNWINDLAFMIKILAGIATRLDIPYFDESGVLRI